jgi:hypothetical protein
MSHVAKLSIAVVLALVAAGLNAMWLSAEKRPSTFVAAKSEIPPGQEITDAMLMEIPVPGDVDALRKALIPYQNRALLLGLTTTRKYVPGDMFFQRDIQEPHKDQQFEILGPFRLISVGERFKQPTTEEDKSRLDAGGNNITIAVSANFDERTRRLLEITSAGDNPAKYGKSNGQTVSKIVAVQVVPKDEPSLAKLADEKNVVYQTISLDGIANVPRVLLEGEVIRFVVPVTESL